MDVTSSSSRKDSPVKNPTASPTPYKPVSIILRPTVSTAPNTTFSKSPIVGSSLASLNIEKRLLASTPFFIIMLSKYAAYKGRATSGGAACMVAIMYAERTRSRSLGVISAVVISTPSFITPVLISTLSGSTAVSLLTPLYHGISNSSSSSSIINDAPRLSPCFILSFTLIPDTSKALP